MISCMFLQDHAGCRVDSIFWFEAENTGSSGMNRDEK